MSGWAEPGLVAGAPYRGGRAGGLAYSGTVTGESMAVAASPAGGETVERVLALLRAHGGRATPAKRLLLAAMAGSPGHRSAEELAAAVQQQAPDVHRSTIYRNLEELERLQVIDRTQMAHGPATYHLASAAHGHLVCENCGSITELPSEAFRSLADTARRRHGFTINPGRFAVTGRCAACQ